MVWRKGDGNIGRRPIVGQEVAVSADAYMRPEKKLWSPKNRGRELRLHELSETFCVDLSFSLGLRLSVLLIDISLSESENFLRVKCQLCTP